MRVPPVIGERWQVWAEDLRKYLGKAQSQLAAKEDSSSAREDGVILWDRVNQEPVVSVSGAWVALGGGGGVSDGDYGDITVSGAGTVWTIDSGAVDATEVANLATTVQAYTLDTFANPVASMDFNDQQAVRFVLENRTSDPGSPVSGSIWLRTDL